MNLSPKQKHILRLYSAGKRVSEIAKELGLSHNSITLSIQRMRKAGVNIPYRRETKPTVLYSLDIKTGKLSKVRPVKQTYNAARHASIKNLLRTIRTRLDKIEALSSL